MSYKIGFILSLVFIVELFILAGDLFSAQIIYTNLDAISVTVGSVISSKGGITEEIVRYVEDSTGGYIVALSEETPVFGEIFEYKIAKQYKLMSAANSLTEISVTRGVVIGYYN